MYDKEALWVTVSGPATCTEPEKIGLSPQQYDRCMLKKEGIMKKTAFLLPVEEINLAAEIFIPGEEQEKYPALCLCHGLPAGPPEPGKPGYGQLAEVFCNAGFITLIFSFRGAGDSEGNLDMQGWTRDLKAAIDYLYGMEQIDRSRIILLGSSAGGAVSIDVAAGDKRVAAVGTFACPAHFDFPQKFDSAAMVEHYRSIGVIRDKDFPPSNEEWLKGFTAISPVHSVAGISPRPLLLVHGDSDDVVPLHHAHELFNNAGEPKKLEIIKGAGHRLRHVKEAVDIALKWLQEFKNQP
jgi:alpha-beta hydrolase superfamily lysophospholipase